MREIRGEWTPFDEKGKFVTAAMAENPRLGKKYPGS
jgi:hypothetical protein